MMNGVLLDRPRRQPRILDLSKTELMNPDLVWRDGKPYWQAGRKLVPAMAGAIDAYYTTPLPPFASAIGNNFNTFTVRQDVSPLPLPILPAAPAVRLGSIIKVEAEGEWSATATPTFVLGFYAGIPGASGGGTITSILAESVANATTALTSIPWHMDYIGKVVTLGTAGSIVGSGILDFGTTLTAVTSTSIPITLALRTVAINTNVNNAIGVCATCSASSASNNIRVYTIAAYLIN